MKMKREYTIKPETIMILPDYNEHGFLQAVLCNRQGFAKAELSPYDLIDYNLRYHGSSIRGATDGALAMLGKVYKNPIILDKEHDIILFPCKSPFKEDCVWFSLRHILDTVEIDKNHTQVQLSNGSSITIDVSKKSFDKKMQTTYELQFKMRARKLGYEDQDIEIDNPYHLFKNVKGMYFEDGLF